MDNVDHLTMTTNMKKIYIVKLKCQIEVRGMCAEYPCIFSVLYESIPQQLPSKLVSKPCIIIFTADGQGIDAG